MFTFSKFSKKLAVFMAVGVLAVGLAGCGSDTKQAQPEKVLRVGSETTFPPFEFVEKDKYVGFDVELSEAIAKKLGYKMEFVSMGFDALIPAIQTDHIDMIAAGINATPERAKAIIFSDIYYKDGGYIIIAKKDNTTFSNLDSLANKTIAAQIGTVPVDLAKSVPGSTTKELDSNSQIFMELQAGTVDAAIMDTAVAKYYLKQGADKDLKLVGEPMQAEGVVLGFKKDNTKLRDDVNKALKELKEDGTYKKLYEKWFGPYEGSKSAQ